MVASAIQLACVKRAILCELLHTGKWIHLPKDTSSAVNRMLEKTIKDYKDLAKAFEAQEWKDVLKIVQTKKSTFTQVCPTRSCAVGTLQLTRRMPTTDSCSRSWSRSRNAAS